MRLFRHLQYLLRASPLYKYLDQFTRNAQLFLLSTLIGGVTFSGFQLFFNIYLRSRGYDLDFIGLLNALPSGAALLVGVPMGVLSDRLGRRRSMLIGLTVATWAAWVLVTTETQGLMVFMSAVMGAANSLYFLSMAPFMMRASREKERTLLFSLNFGLMTISGSVGNLLAGQLPAWFGAWLGVGAESASLSYLMTSVAPQVHVSVGSMRQCAIHQPRAARLTMNHLHWLTSGATSFARGMNDAPKIVALALSAAALAGAGELVQPGVFAIITVAMVAGSAIGGLRVTQLLAEKVTPLDHREGFVANLVASLLVGTGAVLGLPMSTTHVASGTILGIGVANGGASVNRRTVRDMLLAWVVTLPAAALLGVMAYAAARSLS